MRRLTAKIVRSGLVTAWRFAGWPTSRSPSSVKATMDGVVRIPSAFSMTFGVLPSITATHELVVPRSIPIALAMTALHFVAAPAHAPTQNLQSRLRTPGMIGDAIIKRRGGTTRAARAHNTPVRVRSIEWYGVSQPGICGTAALSRDPCIAAAFGIECTMRKRCLSMMRSFRQVVEGGTCPSGSKKDTFRGPRSGGFLDLDFLCFRLRRLRNCDLQDAVRHGRLHLGRIDADRQLQDPIEHAVASFAEMNIFALVFLFVLLVRRRLDLLFPTNGEDIVFKRDLDVFSLQ